MFENLSERLERSLKILKGEGKITEVNVAETLKDVRKALLDADVADEGRVVTAHDRLAHLGRDGEEFLVDPNSVLIKILLATDNTIMLHRLFPSM